MYIKVILRFPNEEVFNSIVQEELAPFIGKKVDEHMFEAILNHLTNRVLNRISGLIEVKIKKEY